MCSRHERKADVESTETREKKTCDVIELLRTERAIAYTYTQGDAAAPSGKNNIMKMSKKRDSV